MNKQSIGFVGGGRVARIILTGLKHGACPVDCVVSDADSAYDGLIFLGDDRVLLVKGLILASLTSSGSQGAVYGEEEQESSVMEIICCRMKE